MNETGHQKEIGNLQMILRDSLDRSRRHKRNPRTPERPDLLKADLAYLEREIEEAQTRLARIVEHGLEVRVEDDGTYWDVSIHFEDPEIPAEHHNRSNTREADELARSAIADPTVRRVLCKRERA